MLERRKWSDRIRRLCARRASSSADSEAMAILVEEFLLEEFTGNENDVQLENLIKLGINRLFNQQRSTKSFTSDPADLERRLVAPMTEREINEARERLVDDARVEVRMALLATPDEAASGRELLASIGYRGRRRLLGLASRTRRLAGVVPATFNEFRRIAGTLKIPIEESVEFIVHRNALVTSSRWRRLTPREHACYLLQVLGLRAKAIAAFIDSTPKSVSVALVRARKKLLAERFPWKWIRWKRRLSARRWNKIAKELDLRSQ